MFTIPYRLTIFVLAFSLIPGCATNNAGRELTGAGIGAAMAAGIAALAGGDTKTIIASAAGGAVAGWSIAKLTNYQSNKTRTVEKDNEVFGLTEPAATTLVKIRRGSSSPETVKPGDFVNIVTDYSIIAPESVESIDVEESWQLKKDGKELAALDPQFNKRSVGGWATKAQILIPPEAENGTYVIEHKIQAGTSYDVDQSVFVVQ